jgi:hypothetical protein
MFWNSIGRPQEEIKQTCWARFCEVKGCDGASLPARELPPLPLKPRVRAR